MNTGNPNVFSRLVWTNRPTIPFLVTVTLGSRNWRKIQTKSTSL